LALRCFAAEMPTAQHKKAFIMSASHLTNVVATPLCGVCIFGARHERRTAPWLQRVRIYEMGWVLETSVILV